MAKYPVRAGVVTRAAMLLVPVLISACMQQPPRDQVLARVDGDDVTRRDVAAEIAASPAAYRGDDAIHGPALAAVVDRRLLVQEAYRRGLDRTPDYIAGIRRLREVLLVQLLDRQLRATAAPVSPDRIATFQQEHPWMFGRRQTIAIHRIAFDARGLDPDAMATRPSPAIAAMLTDAHRDYREDQLTLDTARLPQTEAERLEQATPGSPLVFRDGNTAAIVTIRSRTPAPVAGRAARLASESVMAQDMIEKADGILVERRRDTAIVYQEGYGPGAR